MATRISELEQQNNVRTLLLIKSELSRADRLYVILGLLMIAQKSCSMHIREYKKGSATRAPPAPAEHHAMLARRRSYATALPTGSLSSESPSSRPPRWASPTSANGGLSLRTLRAERQTIKPARPYNTRSPIPRNSLPEV